MNDAVTLADCIPIRQRRQGAARKNISLRPETHQRLEALARELNVSMPDALDTLLNYIEEDHGG